MSDTEFNTALRKANVVGCAYGYEYVEGMGRQIPAITLVGTEQKGFIEAFQHFERWGCLEDGDALDVQMLLRRDGSYELWFGPEVSRSLYKTIPLSEIYDALAFNVSWVKRLDSTHALVRQLKKYCESGLNPVAISAAIVQLGDLTGSSMRPLKSWEGIIKFDLRIVDETDAPDDPRFRLRESKTPHAPAKEKPSPSEMSVRRTKTLDVVFPVTRERIRRSALVQQVREIPGFGDIYEVQVVQAVINLMMSSRLVPGDRHYSRIKGDFARTVWDAIAGHTEVADGRQGQSDQPLDIIATQIELDVLAALDKHGQVDRALTFQEQQAKFRQAGYVNE